MENTRQATELTPDVHLFLFHALLLRLQSGTNCRHVNLASIPWKHVEKHEHIVGLNENIFSVKVVPTKEVRRGGEPVEFYATDPITASLFQYWHLYHSHKGAWFFPKVSKDGSMDFNQQMDYQSHGIACKLCAEILGLQMSSEFKKNLGAKAIKRGNAAKLGVALKGCWTNKK